MLKARRTQLTIFTELVFSACVIISAEMARQDRSARGAIHVTFGGGGGGGSGGGGDMKMHTALSF